MNDPSKEFATDVELKGPPDIPHHEALGRIHNSDKDFQPVSNSVPYNNVFDLTNLKGDHFWNSRAVEGDPYGSGTSHINSEAHFKDGEYDIEIEAEDRGTNKGTRTKRVLLDNFAPYIDQLSVNSDKGLGGKLYIGDWSDSADNGGTKLVDTGQQDVTAPQVVSNDMFNAQDSWAVIMNFTEPMNTSQNPTVSAKMSNGSVQPLSGTITWSNDSAQAVLRTDRDPLGANAVSGLTTIQVSAVKDMAGHLLDAEPKSIAHRDASGNFVAGSFGYQSGPDKNHKLRIDAVAPTIAFLGWYG